LRCPYYIVDYNNIYKFEISVKNMGWREYLSRVEEKYKSTKEPRRSEVIKGYILWEYFDACTASKPEISPREIKRAGLEFGLKEGEFIMAELLSAVRKAKIASK